MTIKPKVNVALSLAQFTAPECKDSTIICNKKSMINYYWPEGWYTCTYMLFPSFPFTGLSSRLEADRTFGFQEEREIDNVEDKFMSVYIGMGIWLGVISLATAVVFVIIYKKLGRGSWTDHDDAESFPDNVSELSSVIDINNGGVKSLPGDLFYKLKHEEGDSQNGGSTLDVRVEDFCCDSNSLEEVVDSPSCEKET